MHVKSGQQRKVCQTVHMGTSSDLKNTYPSQQYQWPQQLRTGAHPLVPSVSAYFVTIKSMRMCFGRVQWVDGARQYALTREHVQLLATTNCKVSLPRSTADTERGAVFNIVIRHA
jgi:hypothetical protein